jgi:hypothetical protein
MFGKRFGVSRLELLVTFAITLLLIALLMPAIQQARHGRSQLGERALDDAPRESRRFLHRESGISIVMPDYWEIRTTVPKLEIYAHNAPIGLISVCAVSPQTAKNSLGYKRTRHGDWPAYELMMIARESTFEDPAISIYNRLVETSAGWFKIEYTSDAETTTLPEGPRRFLDTVRFPDKPVAKEFVLDVDLPSPPPR